jgi:hypothetical protein
MAEIATIALVDTPGQEIEIPRSRRFEPYPHIVLPVATARRNRLKAGDLIYGIAEINALLIHLVVVFHSPYPE